jgi:cell wall-associated NlpC family hydrolase
MNLDPRLHAYRPDLADARLKGKVAATRFVEGTPRRVVADSAPIKAAPSTDTPLATEALRGERVTVFDDTHEGWSWVQLGTDNYVGYMPTGALGPVAPEPTHRIAALRAFVYPGPDMKLPPAGVLSFASEVALAGETTTRGTAYRVLAGGEGAIVAIQAAPRDTPPENDFVAVAERFLNVAYLWGGRTSLGLDCSALVQLSLAATGVHAPRDTDLQELALGAAVTDGSRRGDLVFWKGHVAIMIDGEHAVHATGHAMAVVIEPLAAIESRAGRPTSTRRLG